MFHEIKVLFQMSSPQKKTLHCDIEFFFFNCSFINCKTVSGT